MVRTFTANFRNVFFFFFSSFLVDHETVALGKGLPVSVSQVHSLIRTVFVQFAG